MRVIKALLLISAVLWGGRFFVWGQAGGGVSHGPAWVVSGTGGTTTQTSFTLDAWYTNNTGKTILVKATASSAAAGETGGAHIYLMLRPTSTNEAFMSSYYEVAGSTLSGAWANDIVGIVTNGQQYCFTNATAGTGWVGNLVAGYGQITELGASGGGGLTTAQVQALIVATPAATATNAAPGGNIVTTNSLWEHYVILVTNNPDNRHTFTNLQQAINQVQTLVDTNDLFFSYAPESQSMSRKPAGLTIHASKGNHYFPGGATYSNLWNGDLTIEGEGVSSVLIADSNLLTGVQVESIMALRRLTLRDCTFLYKSNMFGALLHLKNQDQLLIENCYFSSWKCFTDNPGESGASEWLRGDNWLDYWPEQLSQASPALRMNAIYFRSADKNIIRNCDFNGFANNLLLETDHADIYENIFEVTSEVVLTNGTRVRATNDWIHATQNYGPFTTNELALGSCILSDDHGDVKIHGNHFFCAGAGIFRTSRATDFYKRCSVYDNTFENVSYPLVSPNANFLLPQNVKMSFYGNSIANNQQTNGINVFHVAFTGPLTRTVTNIGGGVSVYESGAFGQSNGMFMLGLTNNTWQFLPDGFQLAGNGIGLSNILAGNIAGNYTTTNFLDTNIFILGGVYLTNNLTIGGWTNGAANKTMGWDNGYFYYGPPPLAGIEGWYESYSLCGATGPGDFLLLQGKSFFEGTVPYGAFATNIVISTNLSTLVGTFAGNGSGLTNMPAATLTGGFPAITTTTITATNTLHLLSNAAPAAVIVGGVNLWVSNSSLWLITATKTNLILSGE